MLYLYSYLSLLVIHLILLGTYELAKKDAWVQVGPENCTTILEWRHQTVYVMVDESKFISTIIYSRFKGSSKVKFWHWVFAIYQTTHACTKNAWICFTISPNLGIHNLLIHNLIYNKNKLLTRVSGFYALLKSWNT